jgi:hypothetical protein
VVVVSQPYLYSYDPFFFGPFWGSWGGYPWGGYPFPLRFGPPDARIRLDVRPHTAKVYVDGYFAGTVDDFDGVFQRLHVTPGPHEVVVHLEGYGSFRQQLYLGPDASRTISYRLEPLPPGEPGEPPPTPAAVPAARDRAAARPAAPPPPDLRRGPVPGAHARVSGAGTLSIRVQPSDAEISIDGESWTPGGDDVELIVQLAEGPHLVEVQRDGYRRMTLEVHVRRNETTPVNVSLSKD